MIPLRLIGPDGTRPSFSTLNPRQKTLPAKDA